MSNKIGLLIVTHNRPNYLERTLTSLKLSMMENVMLCFVDDASSDNQVDQLVDAENDIGDVRIKIKNDENKGIWNSLKIGWDCLKKEGCNILCNLDPDAIVSNDWLERLLDLNRSFEDKDCIVTGFNTKNHSIQSSETSYHIKKSIGGINLLFNLKVYDKIVRPCLVDIKWDWRIVDLAKKYFIPLICSNPSVIQHIGRSSTMPDGRSFDYAEDFKQRVVVSFSTIPSRLNELKPTIQSLKNQTYEPDEIFLSVPQYSKREEKNYIIPDYIVSDEKVTILWSEKDYGPATKLIPAIFEEENPESIIITVDDDNVYHKTMIEDLLHYGLEFPNSAIGFVGHELKDKPYRHPNFNYIYSKNISKPTNVHILEGYLGVLYRKSFFDNDIKNYSDAPEDTFFVDDEWISYNLDKKKISRIIVPNGDLDHSTIKYNSLANGLNSTNENINHQENTLNFFKSKGYFKPFGTNLIHLDEWHQRLYGHGKQLVNSFYNNLVKKEKYNIIDVGGNAGSFTQAIIEKMPINRVLVFEPVEKYFEYIKEKYSDDDRIIVEKFGLSDIEEEITIHISDSYNLGWNTMLAEKVNSENARLEENVQNKVFDQIINQYDLETIDIIKIDTEGYEYKILKGMIESIKKYRPIIACEIAWGIEHPYFSEIQKSLKEIYAIGYSTVKIVDNKTRDYILLPKELDTIPTLCLNMIVKDDAGPLAGCLESVKNHIDYYVIGIDENNKDNSREIIDDILKDVPGEIITVPPIMSDHEINGWGKVRTLALEAATGKADFVLLVDADTELKDFDKSKLKPHVDAYSVMNQNGKLQYFTVRLVKADGNWEYVNRTHEYIHCLKENEVKQRLDGAHIIHYNTGHNRNIKNKRDEELLLADLEDDPTSIRTLFYLAQTMEDKHEFATAIHYYQQRLKVEGYFDEKWEAACRIARCHETARSPWSLIEKALLEAHELNPKRAEPLFKLGKHYYDISDHKNAFKYLNQAAWKDVPFYFLFRDEDVIQKSLEHLCVTAFYAEEYIAGVKAGIKALAAEETIMKRDLITKNLQFYVNKI